MHQIVFDSGNKDNTFTQLPVPRQDEYDQSYDNDQAAQRGSYGQDSSLQPVDFVQASSTLSRDSTSYQAHAMDRTQSGTIEDAEPSRTYQTLPILASNDQSFANEVDSGIHEQMGQSGDQAPQIYISDEQGTRNDMLLQETADTPLGHFQPVNSTGAEGRDDDHLDSVAEGPTEQDLDAAKQIDLTSPVVRDYSNSQNDIPGQPQEYGQSHLGEVNSSGQDLYGTGLYGHNSQRASYDQGLANMPSQPYVQGSTSYGQGLSTITNTSSQPYEYVIREPSSLEGQMEDSPGPGSRYMDNAQASANVQSQTYYGQETASYGQGPASYGPGSANIPPQHYGQGSALYGQGSANTSSRPYEYAIQETSSAGGQMKDSHSPSSRFMNEAPLRMDTSNIIMQPVSQEAEVNFTPSQSPIVQDTPNFGVSLASSPVQYTPASPPATTSSGPYDSSLVKQKAQAPALQTQSAVSNVEKRTPTASTNASKFPVRKQSHPPAKQQTSRTEPRRSVSKQEPDTLRSSIAYLNEQPTIEPPMRAPPPVTSVLPLPSTSPYFNPYANLKSPNQAQGLSAGSSADNSGSTTRSKQLRGEPRPDSVLGSRYGFDMKAVQPPEDKPFRQQPTPNVNPSAVTAKDYSYNIRQEPDGRRLNAGAFRRAPPSSSSFNTMQSGNGSDGAMSPAARLRDEWRASTYTTPMATPAADETQNHLPDLPVQAQALQQADRPDSYDESNGIGSRSNYSHRTSAVDAPTDVLPDGDLNTAPPYTPQEANEVLPLNLRKRSTAAQDGEMGSASGQPPVGSSGGFGGGKYVTAIE